MIHSVIPPLQKLADIFLSLQMDREGTWVRNAIQELEKNSTNAQKTRELLVLIDRKLTGINSLTDIPESVFDLHPDGTEEKVHRLVNEIGQAIAPFLNQ